MIDSRAFADAKGDADRVNTQPSGAGRHFSYPTEQQPPQATGLLRSDRLQWVPVSGAAARLHLNGDDAVTITGDEVKFALPAPAPVPREEAIPECFQIVGRELFTAGSNGTIALPRRVLRGGRFSHTTRLTGHPRAALAPQEVCGKVRRSTDQTRV